MKFAFIVYDGMTLLDFAGVYDPVTRLKTMGFEEGLEYDVCAFTETVRSFEGLELRPDKVKAPLDAYDYVFIPGGNGVAGLIGNAEFVSWLKGVSPNAVLTAVCGGSLLLGAAGFLRGTEATTHPALMGFLVRFTDRVSAARIVECGRIVTARGVTSAIDLGLYLCKKISGERAEEKIRAQMDYQG